MSKYTKQFDIFQAFVLKLILLLAHHGTNAEDLIVSRINNFIEEQESES